MVSVRSMMWDSGADHFTITRVENSRVRLKGMVHDQEVGPFKIPVEIGRRCRMGWALDFLDGFVPEWKDKIAWLQSNSRNP
jgi:hypothetical protein